MTTKVIDNRERARFELFADDRLAGYLHYQLDGDQLALMHTEVFEEFSGRGLAGELVQQALDAARDSGLVVLPHCPYVRRWLGKHPDQVSVVPEEERERFGLAATR